MPDSLARRSIAATESRRSDRLDSRPGADTHSRAGVVDVALRVPERSLILRLRGRRRVPGSDEDLVVARREVDRDAPVPPRPAAEVLEQLGLRPGPAGVDRDVDAGDVALAARERVAAHLERAGRDRVAGRRCEDIR